MISEALYAPGNRHGTITVSAFHIALVLSLLLHLAALWKWLPHLRLNLELPKLGDDIGVLVVHLAPPPQPPAAVAPELAAEPQPAIVVPHAPPRMAIARPRPAPPVIALNKPAPAAPPPPAQPASIPLPPPPAPAGDLASYIEAQRRIHPQIADSAPTAPVIDEETARRNRIVASNLAPRRPPTFGYDPDKHGGLFQIRYVGYDSADFVFFGWNRAARHNTMQEYSVRTGNNGDIRLAVIRKMIAIIRENTQEDFLWESSRLGRNVMLSARPQDNAGLEEFLMREFFVNPRVPQ